MVRLKIHVKGKKKQIYDTLEVFNNAKVKVGGQLPWPAKQNLKLFYLLIYIYLYIYIYMFLVCFSNLVQILFQRKYKSLHQYQKNQNTS